jgi:hypothetical protein
VCFSRYVVWYLLDKTSALQNSSDNQRAVRQQMANLAAHWGLKLVAYEAGPGWDVGDMTDLGE